MDNKELTITEQLYVDACRFIILQTSLNKKLLKNKKLTQQILKELLKE